MSTRNMSLPLVWLSIVTLPVVFSLGSVGAHPISLSSVTVDVREDHVLATMKIMLEDLVLYHGLQANAAQKFAASDLLQAAEQHRAFLLQYFTIRDAEGQRAPGEALRLDTAEIPQDGVSSSELMARHVSYHFAFPLTPRQAFLTFTQTFGGDQAPIPAIMEVVVFHHGALLQRPVELLQGKPYTVRLDWDHPPAHTAQNFQAYQALKHEEFRQQLGITSYSGLYSFIYLTAQEVRHEILLPLLTLEKWLPLARSHQEFFEVAEQEAARDTITAFFRTRNPVEIDGRAVQPEITRLQFFGLDIKDFAQPAAPRRVSLYQARLGIILSYPTRGIPSQVRMTWETFNAYAPFLRSVVYVQDQEPKLHLFETAHPHFLWTRASDMAQPVPAEVPPPASIPLWSLPLLSFGAALGAALWMGVTWGQRTPLWRASRLAGCLACLMLGVLCWPLGRLEMVSPLAATPRLSDPEVREVSLALLHNIYGAFAYRQESDIYDALAQSVDGRLLADLYLHVQKGLQMQEQGGAVARVQEVALTDHTTLTSGAQANGLPHMRVQCRWQVTGTVEHWGHIHTRVNAYEAILAFHATSGAWKLTSYEVLNEHRVRSETGLRTVKRPG